MEASEQTGSEASPQATHRRLADMIREGREMLLWTQQDLAERLRVNSVQVSRWENGHAIPSAKTTTDLALYLNVDLRGLAAARARAIREKREAAA